MLKQQTIIGVIGGLFVLLVAANTSHAQSAKLFVSESQGGVSTQVYRYEVGPTGVPTLDLIITDPSFDAPCCLAFGTTGEMFVVNRGFTGSPGNGSISRFLNPAGSPLFNGTITSSSFSGPHFAVFRMGELFVAQRFGNNVLRFVFAAAGNASFNGAITSGLGGTAPRGVTVNPTTGELFVTECCGVNEVNRYLFDASGNAIPNGVITGGGLSNPHDMAFSPWGELFVPNPDNNSISRFIFDAAGNASPNGQITGNGLNGPLGLDFSPWGELFVSNHFGAGGVSRWTFDTSFNAIPNGSFPTPTALGDLQFFPVITVIIDIKPGTFPNSINLGSGGSVPVAIVSTASFDATIVDPLTVTLAGATVALKGKGTPMASFQDVNGDSLLDLVVHVSTKALQLSDGDTVAVLEAQTFGGTRIRGTDLVRIVP